MAPANIKKITTGGTSAFSMVRSRLIDPKKDASNTWKLAEFMTMAVESFQKMFHDQ
jgi:hypothetical protein